MTVQGKIAVLTMFVALTIIALFSDGWEWVVAFIALGTTIPASFSGWTKHDE